MENITKEEQNAINSLKRLAERWPESLWLFTNGNGIYIMRRGPNGERVMTGRGEGVDPDYMVDNVDLPCDGGDW